MNLVKNPTLYRLTHTKSHRTLCFVAKTLIANGANVNAVDSDGMTAIFMAASWGFLPYVEVSYQLHFLLRLNQ